MMDKFRRYGAALAILVSGMMVAIMVPGRGLQIVAIILTFAAIWVAARRPSGDEDEDRGYGPGA